MATTKKAAKASAPSAKASAPTADASVPAAILVTSPAASVPSPAVEPLAAARRVSARPAAKPVAPRTAGKATDKVAGDKAVARTASKKATAPSPAPRSTSKPATSPTATPKADKTDKAKKPKLVRDSFTIPKLEYAVLDDLKQRAARLGRSAKKSEVLRAGIKALAAMSDDAFVASLAAVPAIKTGRPASE